MTSTDRLLKVVLRIKRLVIELGMLHFALHVTTISSFCQFSLPWKDVYGQMTFQITFYSQSYSANALFKSVSHIQLKTQLGQQNKARFLLSLIFCKEYIKKLDLEELKDVITHHSLWAGRSSRCSPGCWGRCQGTRGSGPLPPCCSRCPRRSLLERQVEWVPGGHGFLRQFTPPPPPSKCATLKQVFRNGFAPSFSTYINGMPFSYFWV